MADILVPMSAADVGTPATVEILQQILAAKYFFVATLTMLLYDHILTFPSEVQTVWKKKKTYTLLFFLVVRYYAPLAMIVVSVGYFATIMTDEHCQHWILFLPFGISLSLTVLPGILMLLRVYALYNRSKLIFAGLSTFLLAQTAAGIWQGTVPGGTPVPDPVNNYEFHICLYAPPVKIGNAASLYTCMALAYDTLVFLLTLTRTLYMFWKHQGQVPRSGSLMENLVRDGAMYFAAIFSMNLTWVIMIFQAPPGLRDIAAMPASCVTTVMICRITLNLRTTAYGPPQLDERTENPNDIPLSKLRSLRSPRAAASQAASAVLPVVSPSILQIGRKDAENSEEGNGWRLSGPLDISQSMRKVDPDP